MAKIEIPDKLYNDIIKFCEVNNIQESPEKYCLKLLRERYYVEKYGTLNNNVEKTNSQNNTKNNSINTNEGNDDDESNSYDEIFDR